MIGSFMWAAVAAQSDIAFTVSLLSQFLQNLHWNAVKCILKYPKGTIDYNLIPGRSQEGLVGYADADWALQAHTHPISAYICFTSWENHLMKLPKAIHHPIIDRVHVKSVPAFLSVSQPRRPVTAPR